MIFSQMSSNYKKKDPCKVKLEKKIFLKDYVVCLFCCKVLHTINIMFVVVH